MIPDKFCLERTGADALVAGWYLIAQRRRRRVDIPVQIWFGPPQDDEGNELDRGPRWQVRIGFTDFEEEPVTIAGITFAELSDVWPACAREPIPEEDYRYRLERARWAGKNDPNDAFGEIGGRIDPMTVTLP